VKRPNRIDIVLLVRPIMESKWTSERELEGLLVIYIPLRKSSIRKTSDLSAFPLLFAVLNNYYIEIVVIFHSVSWLDPVDRLKVFFFSCS